MPSPSHLHPSDLHGLSKLAVDGVIGTSGLVEQLHATIARTVVPIGRSGNGRTRGITGLVYRSIHGVTGLVGSTANFAFGQVVPHLDPRQSTPRREQLLATINGVLGDHLVNTDNPLAIPMRLRRNGQVLELTAESLAESVPQRTGKLLITLHGLCMNDLQWTPADRTLCLPSGLAENLGYTPLFLNYNSGRHISTNAQQLADLLETLIDAWPEPVEELALVGHSMGGLMARSACHYADLNGHHWPNRVRRIIMLGSPHHGAPLERAGNGLDRLLGLTPYSAPFTRLGRIRSAGITDLRHGNLLDEDWNGHDCHLDPEDRRHPVRLIEHIDFHVVAATTDDDVRSMRSRHLGDGLVPIDSALGRHPDPAFHLPIKPDHQLVVCNTGHLALIHHEKVQQTVHQWLANPCQGAG